MPIVNHIFRERRRPSPSITDEILEKRILLEKQWAKYKNDQHLSDAKMLDRILQSHQRALQELRNESEELYQAAVQVCDAQKFINKWVCGETKVIC